MTRARKYGVGGCRFRYDETRKGMGRHKALRTVVLPRRCDLRNSRWADKSCTFPERTHKDCPIAEGKER